MAYTVFNPATPDPTTENGTVAFDSTRENLLAVRDAIIASGFFPGWSAELQDSDGTPAIDPTKPDQAVYAKGAERIKLSITWGTTGGATDNPEIIVAAYSANAGTLYEPMGATGYPLGKMTLSYDANGSYLSHAWS
ncbi:MAG: hypothetical protein KZQ95_01735 [Candidatus Thiodiazotropha sp. (ex Epidulcina cf. delphinae)]|nr:hypothetical protein [Candidatus Thiodiazotropha sp. (ex Epidulcina cf. delphinae)]